MLLQKGEATYTKPQNQKSNSSKNTTSNNQANKETTSSNSAAIKNNNEEINRKIRNLTQEKVNIESQLKRYNESLTSADKIYKDIIKSMTDVNKTKNLFSKYYKLNGKIADGGKLEIINEKLNANKKDLTDIVIPSIKQEISKLQNQLSQKEKQISDLRRQYV